MSARVYHVVHHKDSNLRIACAHPEAVIAAHARQYALLEVYLRRHPDFHGSLAPLDPLPAAPEIAHQMAQAARAVGVGPMAAVAGTLAHYGAEAAVAAGCRDVIVENGGDLYLILEREAVIGIYAGDNPVAAHLAFLVTPADTPVAICSSSGRMGHSLSLGQCDLATVVAESGALADAVATLVANRIRDEADLEPVLNDTAAIPGLRGILAVQGDKLGMVGTLPRLVRNIDATTPAKVTRDSRSRG